MGTPAPAPRPDRSRASPWFLGGSVLVGVLVLVFVISRTTGGAVDHTTGQDVTAWQSRLSMEQAMTETAASIGLAVQAREPQSGALTCDLPGGGQGWSYLVRGFQGPAVTDLETALPKVRAAWESKGWKVVDQKVGDGKGLRATLPDGGSFALLSNSDTTIFTGESGCARTAGGPATSPMS